MLSIRRLVIHDTVIYDSILIFFMTHIFQYSGLEVVNSQACKKYTLVDTKGQKVNKYTYWLRTEVSFNKKFVYI